jgi:hypothetical protein
MSDEMQEIDFEGLALEYLCNKGLIPYFNVKEITEEDENNLQKLIDRQKVIESIPGFKEYYQSWLEEKIKV